MSQNFHEYPIFEANQVLNANHLNDMRNYLEEQIRMTRNRTIGIGIVCGLNLRYNLDKNMLVISEGTAVTSEGHLIEIAETHYSRYRIFEDRANPKYPYLLFDRNPLLELLPVDFEANRDEVAEIQNINDRMVEDQVVLFYLECLETDLKNCDLNDCSDKGKKVNFNLRVLLISKEVAKEILKREEELKLIKGSLKKVFSKPLTIDKFNAPASSISSYTQLNNRYSSIMGNSISGISSAINKSLNILLPILEPFYNADQISLIQDMERRLKERSQAFFASSDSHWGIQYFYSLLRDLTQGYNECREAIMTWISECYTNELRFPKHILLGEVHAPDRIGSNDDLRIARLGLFSKQEFDPMALCSVYRHRYIPVHQKQGQPFYKEQVISLHYRMVQMLQRFFENPIFFQNNTLPLRITGSRNGNAALSEKAIPFYYPFTLSRKELNANSKYDLLLQNWSFNKTINLATNSVQSYHLETSSLRNSDQCLDFYRIEGHLGKTYSTALRDITAIRQTNGLDFDIVLLKMGANSNNVKIDKDYDHYFEDLDASYRLLKKEFICLLNKKTSYFNALQLRAQILQPVSNTMFFTGTLPFSGKAHYKTNFLDNAAINNGTQSNVTNSKANYSSVGTMHRIFEEAIKAGETNTSELTSEIVKDRFGGIAATAELPLVSGWLNTVFTGMTEINKVKEALKGQNLAEFDLSVFNDRIDVLKNALQAIRKKFINEGSEIDVNDLDAITFIDIVLNQCPKAKFKSLIDERNQRINKLKNTFLFPNYMSKHPSIEHWGGVPKGGTFVMVYHESDKPRGKFEPSFDLALLNVNPLNERAFVRTRNTPLPDVSPLGGINITARENAVNTQPSGSATAGRSFADRRIDPAGFPSLNAFDNSSGNIIIDSPGRNDNRSNLPKGVVLADFCLPYRCSSDTPSVTYIAQKADIEIELDQRVYCRTDTKERFITVNPSGGQITGAIEIKETDPQGRFIFIPADQPIGEMRLTYTLENIQKQFTLEVVRPDSKFKLSSAEIEEGNEDVFVVDAIFEPETIQPSLDYIWEIFNERNLEIPLSTFEGTKLVSELTFDKFFFKYVIKLTAFIKGGNCQSVSQDRFNLERFKSIGVEDRNAIKTIKLKDRYNKLKDNLSKSDYYDNIPANKRKDLQDKMKFLEDITKTEGNAKKWIKGDNTTAIVKLFDETIEPLKAEIDKALTELDNKKTEPNRRKVHSASRLYQDFVFLHTELIGSIEDEDLSNTKKVQLKKRKDALLFNAADLEVKGVNIRISKPNIHNIMSGRGLSNIRSITNLNR